MSNSDPKQAYNFGLGVRLPYKRGVSVIHKPSPWIRVLEGVLAFLLVALGAFVAVRSNDTAGWIQFGILIILTATLIWDLLVPPHQPSYLLVTKKVIIQLHMGVRTRFSWSDFSVAAIEKPGANETSMGTAIAENLNIIAEEDTWTAVFKNKGDEPDLSLSGSLFRNPQEAFDVLQIASQEFLTANVE